MDSYTLINEKLTKKQVIEKIKMELVYEFLILNNDEMDFFKVEDVNIMSDDEYMKLFDKAINELNSRTSLGLKRNSNKIYLGN